MTIEYVLLLALYVGAMMGVMMKAPNSAFMESGPRLGARIEVHLATGDGFKGLPGGQKNRWIAPK